MTTCAACHAEFDSGFRFCPKCGTAIAKPGETTKALEGRTLSGKYRLLSRVGEGAMGTVYLAEHTALRKKVAVKVLHPDLGMDDELIKRFQLEGIAAGKFTHPNAIQIFDFDRGDGDVFYLAMEYVEGKSLKSLIQEKGVIPAAEAIPLVRQVLSALAEAHRQGIVHRDLKPENIMVTEAAEGGLTIKILDFGISKLRDLRSGDPLLTQTGRIIGTPLYMAPEQMSGDPVDHRADLYAVALILYEMLTGSPPFDGENVSQILYKKSVEKAPRPSSANPDARIPEDLDRLIGKALERRPDDRFRTAQEMIDALLSVRAGRIAVSRPPTRGASPARRVAIAAAAVLALAAAAYFLGPALFGPGGAPAPPPRLSAKPAAERTEIESRYVSLLEGARDSLRARELTAALGQAEKAVMMECRDSEAYFVRGLAHFRRGDLDAAGADIDEALRMDPAYVDAICARGWLAFGRRDYAASRASFESARRLAPRSAAALTGLGAVEFEERDRESAVRRLEEAIGIDPTFAEAHLWLGRARSAEGRLDLAAEAFLHAKRHDGRLAEAHLALAETYEAQERLDSAERAYRDALVVDSGLLEARLGLAGVLLALGRNADAESQLDDVVRRHPESARGHILRGILSRAQGRVDDAIASLRRGIALDRRDIEARVLLGILLQTKGDPAAAIGEYEAVLDLDSSVAVARQNIGLCEHALGRHDAARETLRAALEIDETLLEAHLALGILEMEFFDDTDVAITHFRRYQELGGSDPRVTVWLKRL